MKMIKEVQHWSKFRAQLATACPIPVEDLQHSLCTWGSEERHISKTWLRKQDVHNETTCQRASVGGGNLTRLHL